MLSRLFRSTTVEDLVRAGEFRAALEKVDEGLGVQPSDPALLELRAQMLSALGRDAEAGELYMKLADDFAERGFGVRAIALLKRVRPTPPGLDQRIQEIAALAHLDDVATSPLFGMFSREELVSVVRHLRAISFEPGEFVLVQGKPGDSLYVIASGEVRVFLRDEEGWPRQIRLVRAPAFFGEVAVVEGGTRTATVIAASRVDVLELPAAELDTLAETKPRIREIIREFATKRRAERGSSFSVEEHDA